MSKSIRGAWLLGAALSACSPAKTSEPLPKAPSAPRQAPSAPRQAPKSELEQRLAELDDEPKREEAIARLEAMFDEALVRSEHDRSRDPAKSFIDASVARLTELYVGDLAQLRADERIHLLELLGRYEDRRSEPALRLAIEQFAANPAGTKELLDAKRAIRATAGLRLPELDAPLLQAFLALRASAEAGVLLAQDLEIALFAARSPGWVEPLLSVLAKELPPPAAAPSAGRNRRTAPLRRAVR